jgi:hypothetical protein
LGFTPKAPALPYVTDINAPADQVKILQNALKIVISDPTTNPDLIETRSSHLLGGIYFGFDLSSYQKAMKDIESTATMHCPRILEIPKEVPITNISTVLEESWINEDFILLHYLKDILCSIFQDIIQNTSGHQFQIAEIEDRLKKLVESNHYIWKEDGKMIRTIFPSLDSLKQLITYTDSGPQISTESLMFVGFIGSSSGYSTRVSNLWKADADLVAQLKDVSICYISGPRNNERSDWGNLVVIKDETALTHWSKVSIHNQSVREVAPLVYTNVRIHRGHLPVGLKTPKFNLLRTLFLDYPSESHHEFVRLPVFWSEFSESFSDRKLRASGDKLLGQCLTELQQENVFVQVHKS